ncbi:MAG: hypothetical protein Q7S01_03815 [bacterium]|nr:hypothetical protein [bacterium]
MPPNKYLINALVVLFGFGLLFLLNRIDPALSIAVNSTSQLAQAGMVDEYGYTYPWVDNFSSDNFYPATVDYGYSQNNVDLGSDGSYPFTNSPENLQTQIPWENGFAPDSYSYLQSPDLNNQSWTDKAGTDLSANVESASNQNVNYQDAYSLYGSPSNDITQRDLGTYGLGYSSYVPPAKSTWDNSFFQSWFSPGTEIAPSGTFTNITDNSDVIGGGAKDDRNLLLYLSDRYSLIPPGYSDTDKQPTADFSGETNWITLSGETSSITPVENRLNLPDLPTASDSIVDKIRGGLERFGSLYKSRTESEQPATFFNSPASSPTSVGRNNLYEVTNGAYTTGIRKVEGGAMLQFGWQTDAFFSPVKKK